MAVMRKLIFATTAAAALALGANFAFAQSGSPETPKQQEKTPPPTKGGKQETPAAKPPVGSPGGKGPTATPAPGTPGAKGQTQNAPSKTVEPSQPRTPSTAAPNQKNAPTKSPTSGGQDKGGNRARVEVTEQQRTRIHETATHEHMRRVDRVDFSLTVGIVVPQTVVLYPLPPSIIEIVPDYAGFEYILVGDNLVIIDPGSLLIVAVLPI